MPYVKRLTDVLSQHLPWHRARLKFIARFVLSVLQLTTTNLRRIAVALKADVNDASNYRRIRRFLKDYDVDYPALSRLLCRLLPQDPPYVLVLDRTEWHFRQVPVNVLMIGIAHRGVAVPLAWQTLSKAGSSGAGEQIEVLAAALKAVAPSDVEALVADREFISAQWLRRLDAQDIPFVIRLRSGRRLHLGDDGPEDSGPGNSGPGNSGPGLPARMYARGLSVGQSRVVGMRTLCGSEVCGSEPLSVRVQVTVRRIGSDAQPLKDRFLVLATLGVEPERAPHLYRQRWEVETLFAALKSRGFDLEKTHLTKPDRIRRLIGLLALAMLWSHLIGEKRAEKHGPPPTKSHGRRARSLFRYGLDRL